ncbi:MAG: formate acetyltransferase, partial [Clostridiales bacterium]|nr:formate acetyltransferase [Clostridiales bacterium]
MEQWKNFNKGNWCDEIDVRDFIQLNYKPYEGDDSFLEEPSEATKHLWSELSDLLKKENESGGTLDIDTETVSTIISHKPGYIDKDHEKIVGLQTDAPLKRAIMPNGGIRMVKQSCEAYGHQLDPKIEQIYTEYRKTHNQGVFDAYTPEIRRARKAGIITGLPDAYGRGRIIGDYRRVPLYGVDRLIQDKERQKAEMEV